MHPFFPIFGRDLPAYSLMMLLGAALGIGLSVLLAKRRKYPLNDQLYAELYAIVGVIVGGIGLYILTMIPAIIEHAGVIFASFENFVTLFPMGIVFYGGLIGGVTGAFIYIRHYKASAAQILECAAPAIPLAHGVGRVGCYLAGCCYGAPTDGPLGVIYPPASLGAPPGVPLLPTPLFEAGLNVLLCAALLCYVLRRPGKGYRALGLYLMAYAVERFTLEFWRGDAVRGFVLGLSTSQLISLLLLPVGLLFVVKFGKKRT